MFDIQQLPEWMSHAECRDEDPEKFFWDTSGAKAVCAHCPVAAQCLDRALDLNAEYGVFGGLTPTERKPLQSERQRELQARGAAEINQGTREHIVHLVDRGFPWNEVEKKTKIPKGTCHWIYKQWRPESTKRGPAAHGSMVDRGELNTR